MGDHDFRTPEAKKWADDFIPPETCGGIDDVQNALEHLRDANSQLRHAAHLWRHVADENHRRLAEIVRVSLIKAAPAENLSAIIAVAKEGLSAHPSHQGWFRRKGRPAPKADVSGGGV